MCYNSHGSLPYLTTVLSCQVRERLGKLLEELTERIIKDRDEHNRTARGLTVGEGVPVQ